MKTEVVKVIMAELLMFLMSMMCLRIKKRVFPDGYSLYKRWVITVNVILLFALIAQLCLQWSV